MSEFIVPPAVQKAAEKFAHDNRLGVVGGRVTISLCTRCGHMENGAWSSGFPDSVVVQQMPTAYPCERCEYMRARHPEIVAWVLGVVSFKQIMVEHARQVAYDAAKGGPV